MERFDEFFLFITSVLGLFFSLLYTLLGYREIVYGFLPLLIIGLVIPIYIGYIRGAILLDMLEERVRGWIYFLSGVGIYIGSAILFVVNKLLTAFGVEAKPFQTALYLGGSFILGYLIGRGRLHGWFYRTIHKTFNHKITEPAEKIYRDTSSSAHSIGICFYISLIVSLSETLEPMLAFMMIFFLLLGVVSFVVGEWDMRRWVNLVQFSDFIEIESKKVAPHVSGRVGNILLVIFIGILTLVAFLWELIPPPWSYGLLIIGFIDFALFILLTRTKHTPVRKKNVPEDIKPELTKLLKRITKKGEEDKKQDTD